MERINNSHDAASILDGSLRELLDEQLTVITLNNAHKVIAIHNEVTKGTSDSVLISVKQIARIAVLDYASGVILAHNHPSGDVRPSKADTEQTEKVMKGLRTLEIQLLDHIIIGDGDFYSFADEKTFSI